MLHVKITFRNGKHRGKALIVNSSPFLMGRRDDCHLPLGGRSVSRKHGAIYVPDDHVIVRDLNSRNGIVINGKKYRGEDARLWHRDVLQVGEWLLRVSVRDENRQPVTSGSSKTNAILRELDEISEVLEGGDSQWMSANGIAEDRSQESTQELDVQVDPNEELDAPDLMEEQVAPAGQEVNQESVDEQEHAPQKLPDHLRPKKPMDSQDAAQQALRRIFGTG